MKTIFGHFCSSTAKRNGMTSWCKYLLVFIRTQKYITKSIFNNLLSALMNIGMRSMQELIFLARWVEFVNLIFSFLSPKREEILKTIKITEKRQKKPNFSAVQILLSKMKCIGATMPSISRFGESALCDETK